MKKVLKQIFNIFNNLRLLIKFLSLFDVNFAVLDNFFDNILLCIDEKTRQFVLNEIEKNMLELKAEQQAEAEKEAAKKKGEDIAVIRYLTYLLLFIEYIVCNWPH